MIQLHASTSLLGLCQLCQLLSPTEGECSRSASGVMMRSGAGKHTSAGGVIYTGEWCEDQVCVYCVCTLLLMMYGPLWLLIHALSHSVWLVHRCMAGAPCSIPLEHVMKENSKTTRTTAREHTPSQTVVLTKVTFTRTGEKQTAVQQSSKPLIGLFKPKS